MEGGLVMATPVGVVRACRWKGSDPVNAVKDSVGARGRCARMHRGKRGAKGRLYRVGFASVSGRCGRAGRGGDGSVRECGGIHSNYLAIKKPIG